MIQVRRMHGDEAATVAALHRSGIPQGFLSRLNGGVRTALYRGIAKSPRSGVWVAVNEMEQVLGFVSGTADVSACYRGVLRRQAVAMAWHALPALASITTWRGIWETLRYPSRDLTTAPDATASNGESTGELLSIVVDHRARGTGAAVLLIGVLEEALREWGYRGIYRVVTMAADPRSNAFYAKVGFRFAGSFDHHGIPMNLYRKAVNLG